MKVGLVVENAVPFVTEEVRALARCGIEAVPVAVFRPPRGGGWERAFGRPVLYPQRGVRGWLAWCTGRGGSVPAAGQLLAVARRERAPARLVALALGVAHRGREEGWVQLHASFASFPAWVAWAASRCLGLPFSFTAHAYDVHRPRPWLGRLLREASFVRAICRDGAERLRALASGEARIFVSHLGVDASRFAPAPGAPADPPEIVCVARLVEKKGLFHLIEAARELAAAGKVFRLRVLGDGPLRARLVHAAAAAGLTGRVRFEGAAEPERVLGVLQRATCFVLPCVVEPDGERDGLPVALLEAMAVGKPVVSTPVGGVVDAVVDGHNGRLVPPAAPQPLARAIAELLERPEERERLGRAARSTVLERFTLGRSAGRLAAALREAAAAHASRGAEAASGFLAAAAAGVSGARTRAGEGGA